METPDLDARLLIQHVMDWQHADLILNADKIVPDDQVAQIKQIADRRVSGEPIDHIVGHREFYGRTFLISRDVLSPRPETEALVEQGLSVISDVEKPHILDLGTGSGAIIITCLAECPLALGVATDISAAALSIARQNAVTHKVDPRIRFLRGEWFEPVEGQYDLILSNPPYITDADMARLDREVRNFDPDIALRGGVDGLTAYRIIIAQAPAYLTPGGWLCLEIGYDQGDSVPALMAQAGFTDIRLKRDLSGQARIVSGQFPENIHK